MPYVKYVLDRLRVAGIVPTADGELIVTSTIERVLGADALAELRTDAADLLALLAALTPSLADRAKCLEAARRARRRAQSRSSARRR